MGLLCGMACNPCGVPLRCVCWLACVCTLAVKNRCISDRHGHRERRTGFCGVNGFLRCEGVRIHFKLNAFVVILLFEIYTYICIYDGDPCPTTSGPQPEREPLPPTCCHMNADILARSHIDKLRRTTAQHSWLPQFPMPISELY